MTVTHTDGFPVVPTAVDAVLLGMGERCEVVVHRGRWRSFPSWPLLKAKNAVARALLSTGGG